VAHALDNPPPLAAAAARHVGVRGLIQQAGRLGRRVAAAPEPGDVAVAGDVEEALLLGQAVKVGRVQVGRGRAGAVSGGQGVDGAAVGGGGVVGVVVVGGGWGKRGGRERGGEVFR
jgi:hypothetical protein